MANEKNKPQGEEKPETAQGVAAPGLAGKIGDDAKIALVRKDGKGKAEGKEFPKNQALALLAIKNPQWGLPENSKFAWNGKDLSIKQEDNQPEK